jgi:hypothetical protein
MRQDGDANRPRTVKECQEAVIGDAAAAPRVVVRD